MADIMSAAFVFDEDLACLQRFVFDEDLACQLEIEDLPDTEGILLP